MNNIFLKNNNLTVKISTLGAEIQSLKKSEKEYIWEGNPDIWEGHSPILFPICGKLADNKFIIDGKEFSLNMHGFAKKSVFEIEKSYSCTMRTTTRRKACGFMAIETYKGACM